MSYFGKYGRAASSRRKAAIRKDTDTINCIRRCDSHPQILVGRTLTVVRKRTGTELNLLVYKYQRKKI